MDDLQRRVAATVERLRAIVAAEAIVITADDRVGEAAAARLVGYAAGSFKNLRSLCVGPSFFNRPLAGSRVTYRLDDLAVWIERAREETL